MKNHLIEIDDFDDPYFEDIEQEFFDCGMCFTAAGIPMGCQLAGTEECQFDCPYRDEYESEEEA